MVSYQKMLLNLKLYIFFIMASRRRKSITNQIWNLPHLHPNFLCFLMEENLPFWCRFDFGSGRALLLSSIRKRGQIFELKLHIFLFNWNQEGGKCCISNFGTSHISTPTSYALEWKQIFSFRVDTIVTWIV